LKILSTSQGREADEYTIKHEPIKSIDLMERAAGKCFDWIYEHAPQLFPEHLSGEGEWVFKVVCGPGNNGGDGLAVARMLMHNGYNVELIVVHFSDKSSKDFDANYEKLGAAAKKQVLHIKQVSELPLFGSDAVIVDAIFGSGINRPAEGIAAEVIAAINHSGAPVISIDMPSGLYADGAKGEVPPAVHSHHVLTFQSPKLAFFLAEYAGFVGKVHVLDIGLHPDFMHAVDTDFQLLTASDVRAIRMHRPRFAHKGSFGHALLIAGSQGKWGAAVLAARAVLKAGAGLLTVHAGSEGATLVNQHLPEAMTSIDEGGSHFSNVPDLAAYRSIAVGPGLGTHPQSAASLKLLIQESKVPLVLDADALNILADNKTWLAFLPKGSILTPHPGEFARLLGEKLCHREGIERQRELSTKHGVYILLKGAHSTLSTPGGKVWINSTGNPGMASGGTGDVLTGIITGLLASGYAPMHAAALGMYIHGLSADLLLNHSAEESILAGEISNNLGLAFKDLGHA
jgi:NAD(P)H-hydrate epimerase